MLGKILLVDDEPSVLLALKRQLHREFDTSMALSGDEGLALLEREGPFAVVVSDMRMPRMDGVQFLATAKERAPDSVRIMLTAASDQRTAIEAVNHGSIFRFLTKPCSPEALREALTAGIEQHQLITAEAEQPVRDQLAGPAGVVMYLRRHEVRVDDRVLELTPTEFAVLRHLLEGRGEVVTTDTVATEIWGTTIDSRNLVEVNISRLRAKLRRVGAEGVITTVRSVGYIIR